MHRVISLRELNISSLDGRQMGLREGSKGRQEVAQIPNQMVTTMIR